MKRFLAVSLITLGLSFSLSAQQHTKSPAATTKSRAQNPRPSTTRKPSGKRIPRAARRSVPPNTVVKPGETGWSTFTSIPGKFSVLMPGKPTDQMETVPSEHGPYTSHRLVLRDPKNLFIIGWVDYHPSFNFNRQAELEMNRDVFVTEMKAKLLNSRQMIMDGHHVIEFKAETVDKLYNSRIYMVGRRPYQILIGSPKGLDDSVNIDRFLSSFKITP